MVMSMRFKPHFFTLLGLCVMPTLSQIANAYDLHEWGTFTTVSGSDGGMLSGLDVEEEQLPSFVYSHKGMRPIAHHNLANPFPYGLMPSRDGRSKGIFVKKDAKNMLVPAIIFKGIPRAMLKNVTVKMETPVIYFYGDDTPKVKVKVGFNGGTISQWYPNRTAGDIPNLITASEHKVSDEMKKRFAENELILHEPINFSLPYKGFIEWDVDIIPKNEADPAYTFKSDENSSWIYPRVPEANMIRVGDEYEDYLFYRGIGNFEMPATFSVDSSETLHVTNNSSEVIPFAFAFENVGGKFRYKTIGKIGTGSRASVSEEDWIIPSEGESQQVAVFQEMRDGLLAQGLTISEANGMVKTWWKSYFEKSGLRVFWVVPQIDVERILPLTVTPKPENQVRVLVGRADVMRPKFEQRLIADLGTHQFNKYFKDRFYKPYRQRLTQLVKDPVFQKFDELNVVNAPLQITALKGSSKLGEGLRLIEGREVKLQHLKLNGVWELVSESELKIGEVLFTLDPQKGILSSDRSLDESYDRYEIQLPRVLN